MKLSDFDFDLPKELIAQYPTQKRDHSNLLIPVIDNNGKIISYKREKFFALIDELKEGDLMVFNDSKVINAKLQVTKNISKISINLSQQKNLESGNNIWLGFAKPGRRLKEGDEFTFGRHKLIIHRKLADGTIEFNFRLEDNISIFEFLQQYGEIPLPLYINRQKEVCMDNERYQTIYANKEGSAAAPTAGLHFTKELVDKIKAKGVETAFVTLHVGAGTFLPVKTENIEDHKMHQEYCEVTIEVARQINKAKEEGRRVITVGTTAMRVLESCSSNGIITAGTMNTDIFIKPGYKFQIADMLITNFHLPKSTLFMLVCTFTGMKEMQELYKYAIDNNMRFFSYGDAMLLTKKKY
ncbi:MAG: tRNA preQ1(34) S-adenosylmethionine ribosyltransferase-isomerase QueA [Rickettsiaceae bacterium]|nr:tRNA preQ1(34) S-adenosylmethionine ribosyltransferase-isomerase QueA [Rickettsiaceae bacterium]